MKLHEYQGKTILNSFGIKTPESRLSFFPDEAWMHSMQIGTPVVLKAQVLVGGRGKSGGIKICKTSFDVKKTAETMFKTPLVTKQTTSKGEIVRKILVEEVVEIKKEFYFAITLDRFSYSPMIVASSEGGMEIEEISKTKPDKIIKIKIDPFSGFRPFHSRKLAEFMEIDANKDSIFSLFSKLYDVFMEKECNLLEINPLILTKNKELIPLDVKMDIDDNALFKLKDIAKLRDMSDQDSDEIEARFSSLNFIKLEGNIGCMVNGAGLAMATMDFIKEAGGTPANFLDVGGVASPSTIEKGFEILSRDKNVKGIFVNIFGGIVRCDRVAKGIINACKNLKPKKPIIIRLSGSNVEEGIEILKKSGLNFNITKNIEDASVILNKILNKKEGK